MEIMKSIFYDSLKYLGWILLFISLWFKGCSSNEKSSTTAKVIVPEVKGKFEAKKPNHKPLLKWSNSTPLKKATSKEILQVENPVNPRLISENEKLKASFAKETDSLKKIILFNKVAQLSSFSKDFEDENVLININGIVQGEVKEVAPNYTIKPKKVEVPVKPKETVFRLLGGVEVGNNTKLDGFAAKANLMLQNRKGNIISGSYDTNQNIWIGYNFSIFNIKK